MASISLNTVIEKFGKMGEKTGWTYITIPFDLAEKLYKKDKKSFRVKGTLDQLKIKGVALIPMGEGEYIMPINNEMRKALKKGKGDHLQIKIELDKEEYQLNNDLVECLQDDQLASTNFYKLPRSHQNYYSKFIDAAKTDVTKGKRIAQILKAMHLNMTYAEMIRSSKSD